MGFVAISSIVLVALMSIDVIYLIFAKYFVSPNLKKKDIASYDLKVAKLQKWGYFIFFGLAILLLFVNLF